MRFTAEAAEIAKQMQINNGFPGALSGLGAKVASSPALPGSDSRRQRLLGSSKELHQTPFGTIQQFLYCYCRVD